MADAKMLINKQIRNVLIVVAVLALVIGIALVRPRCSPVKPVHVSPVPPESVRVVVHDTIPGQVRIVVNRDSLIALERKVQALTDEKESWAHQATALGQELTAIDSAWAARFDSLAGLIAVQYRRGRLDVVQYQRPRYVRVSKAFSAWRNTWTAKAAPGGGLTFVTRRLPVDFGVEAAGDFWTPPTELSPSGLASLCLTARTSQALRWRLGAGWLLKSGPVLVAGARLALEF